MKKIKDLRIGERFTLSKIDNPTPNQIWIKDTYSKSSDEYKILQLGSSWKWGNMKKVKYISKSKKVFTDLY